MTMSRLRIFDVAVVALLLCVHVPFLTVLAQPGASYQAECLIDLNPKPLQQQESNYCSYAFRAQNPFLRDMLEIVLDTCSGLSPG
jgi:hypothetical protein